MEPKKTTVDKVSPPAVFQSVKLSGYIMSRWQAEPIGRMKSVSFYLGLALLFTHELDSMPNHEWRVLPGLSALADSTGEAVFVLAHIPIFAVVVAFVSSLDQSIRLRARNYFCMFLLIHAVLHLAFSEQGAYEFSSWISSGLIYGAGLCGALYFVVAHVERTKSAT